MTQVITTPSAPTPIGPYSQAVVFQSLVYCSGQIALDPKTNQLVSQDIRSQTRQVLTNLQAVLTASGSSLDKVLKTTIFLTDLSQFSAYNEEYAKFFTTNFPARSTVQVAALPKNALIEIDCLAYV